MRQDGTGRLFQLGAVAIPRSTLGHCNHMAALLGTRESPKPRIMISGRRSPECFSAPRGQFGSLGLSALPRFADYEVRAAKVAAASLCFFLREVAAFSTSGQDNGDDNVARGQLVIETLSYLIRPIGRVVHAVNLVLNTNGVYILPRVSQARLV